MNETAPRHLLRDRDVVYGQVFQKHVKSLGTEESPPAPQTTSVGTEDLQRSPRKRPRPPQALPWSALSPSEGLHALRPRPRHLPTASAARPCTSFWGLRRGGSRRPCERTALALGGLGTGRSNQG